MISTVTNQGKVRWMVIDGNFDAEKLIEFLEALIKDTMRKIFLIPGDLRAHHSELVKAWLEARKDRIEVFYLPSHASELRLTAAWAEAAGLASLSNVALLAVHVTLNKLRLVEAMQGKSKTGKAG